ncbi:hypothetical protein TNCV_2472021 [Trichonephila clavipes]|nr:hypothetical protein TNCV_2472021 [Trichonephila clavipes]
MLPLEATDYRKAPVTDNILGHMVKHLGDKGKQRTLERYLTFHGNWDIYLGSVRQPLSSFQKTRLKTVAPNIATSLIQASFIYLWLREEFTLELPERSAVKLVLSRNPLLRSETNETALKNESLRFRRISFSVVSTESLRSNLVGDVF